MKQNKVLAGNQALAAAIMLLVKMLPINQKGAFWEFTEAAVLAGVLYFALQAIIHAMPDSPKEGFFFFPYGSS